MSLFSAIQKSVKKLTLEEIPQKKTTVPTIVEVPTEKPSEPTAYTVQQTESVNFKDTLAEYIPEEKRHPFFEEDRMITATQSGVEQDWDRLAGQKTESEQLGGLGGYHLPPVFDIFVGDSQPSRQYGILGMTAEYDKKVAMDLNSTQTISLFGVQGAGKSYSIGSITEMVLKEFEHANQLPSPLAGVIFHYSESEDYEPEFTSMTNANDKKTETDKLRQQYGIEPGRLKDLVLLVPKDKVQERRLRYPGIPVVPISFASSELGIKEWKFLMGAGNNSAMYLKQFNNLMRSIRNDLTLDTLEEAIATTKLLSPAQKELAKMRLGLAREYVDDGLELKRLVRPGRLLLVDLRDSFIEKEDALSIFVIMLNIFSNAKGEDGKNFNKFIVFDEAHKYMGNKNLTEVIVETIREMRHKGVSLMIASQDPPSLPTEIIELSTMLIAHRFNSPQWLKHIQKSVTHLAHLTAEEMANLKQGEAYLWTNKASDPGFTQKAVKIRTRPRITLHGGATITAK